MGRRSALTAETVKAAYYSGMTIDDIMEAYGVCRTTVASRRKELGLTGISHGWRYKRSEEKSKDRRARLEHSRAERPRSMTGFIDNNHPASLGRKSIFPSAVSKEHPRVLIDGVNQSKVGGRIVKGAWKGMPIYTLTLEERATCPRECKHWNNCLSPETRLLMADMTWKQIGSVEVGDRVAGFDEYPDAGKRRRTRIAAVEKIGRVTEPAFLIETDKGLVRASAGHMWLARQRGGERAGYQWVESVSIRAGDAIQFLFHPWETDKTYDAGRLRGFVEGEGYAAAYGNGGGKKTRTGWAQVPGQLVDEINEIATSKGFRLAMADRVSGVNSSVVRIVDVLGGFREALRFLGAIRPSRLLDRVEEMYSGHVLDGRGSEPATVLRVSFLGERDVVSIQTSTKTLIAEGMASHNCYGNAMRFARRHVHGPAFERRLIDEIDAAQKRHPEGFAVRLHVLGDFYSVEYVDLWRSLLGRCPGLHVFGFTARWRGDDIGDALLKISHPRWKIRFSNAPMRMMSTRSVRHGEPQPADAIPCPQQKGLTKNCGTCALCWQTSRPIAFEEH